MKNKASVRNALSLGSCGRPLEGDPPSGSFLLSGSSGSPRAQASQSLIIIIALGGAKALRQGVQRASRAKTPTGIGG